MAEPSFSDLMTLDATGPDAYRSRPPEADPHVPPGPGRLFGGHVAALALRAATLSAPAGYHPHALHCSFLGQGRPDRPVDLAVTRVRDGRSFSHRLVVARQSGRDVLMLMASFHIAEPGDDAPVPMAVDLPGPDELGVTEGPAEIGSRVWGNRFDVRLLPLPRRVAPFTPTIRFWVRARSPAAEDPVTGACAVVYVSDMHSARSAAAVTGHQEVEGPLTSLDHAVWLHRPTGPNEWFLVDVRPVSTASSRGLVLGTVHTRSGRHVATFTQEVLVRFGPT